MNGSRVVVVEVDGELRVVQAYRWEPIPDEHVVETVPLAHAIEEFVTGWRRERPMRGSGFREPDPSDVEPVSPLAWLATETGLSRDQIRAASRPAENPDTELVVADALVAAIGQPGMFYDGTFTIRQNPRRCCGGST